MVQVISKSRSFNSWEEAVIYCKNILKKFKPDHKRIKLFIGFEVQPALWHDCPMYDKPEDALKQARREDKMERRFKRGK